MIDNQHEIPLSGGRVAKGVVRVGHTVRRPATANSDFVRRLLQHLAMKGFDGVPASLGTDGRGRDIFTFIDGQVPAELAFHDDETLCHAASLIRCFHDLSMDFVVTPATAAAGIEIVCHNDLSPCNFVFRAGVPVAIIDFDASAPGARAHDLGYAAWLWLDLGSPEISASDQQRRLATFLAAYGMRDTGLILDAVLERQSILVAQGQRLGDVAMARWAADCMDWTRRNIQTLHGH